MLEYIVNPSIFNPNPTYPGTGSNPFTYITVHYGSIDRGAIIGSDYIDWAFGSNNNEFIYTYGGSDRIYGGGGDVALQAQVAPKKAGRAEIRTNLAVFKNCRGPNRAANLGEGLIR